MADIKRYLNLITSQHYDKTKFINWLTANLQVIDDISSLAVNMDIYFDIDNAIGAQLDAIGQIVGVSRTVNFQPTDGSSPTLDDTTYKLVLRARVLQNLWDGTIPSLYTMWGVLFSNAYLIIKDNQNMSMGVFIIGLSSQLQKDLATNGYLIPKPMGVSITYSYSSVPLFAFGVEGVDLKGFGEGTWSTNF